MRTLIHRARIAVDDDNSLYDILCRSGGVLIVSSLEGFIKDIHDAVQSDLNTNVTSFAAMPKGMQREFAKRIAYFDGVSEGEIQKRVTQILRFFSANSVNIEMNAFPYKENPNKNPTTNFVDSTFHRYGISSVLHSLSGTEFEKIFNNDSAGTYLLKRRIKRERSALYTFPYRKSSKAFNIGDYDPDNIKPIGNSMWHTFLEHIVKRRHGIVHCDTRDNQTSWELLLSDVDKLEILMYGITFIVATLISKDLSL